MWRRHLPGRCGSRWRVTAGLRGHCPKVLPGLSRCLALLGCVRAWSAVVGDHCGDTGQVRSDESNMASIAPE